MYCTDGTSVLRCLYVFKCILPLSYNSPTHNVFFFEVENYKINMGCDLINFKASLPEFIPTTKMLEEENLI